MKNGKVAVGLLGCGNISDIYLKNLTTRMDGVCVTGIYSRTLSRVREQADKYGVGVYPTLDAMLEDPDVDIVLNITPPLAHEDLNRRCLMAGKHVYTEKPLTLTTEEALKQQRLAREKGLMLCAAPDTFLGAGYQTVRELLDAGTIGKVTSAGLFMLDSGLETWHPSPAFFYQRGGGPVFDRAPYGLTALVTLLGPVDGLFSMTGKAFEQREIKSQPLAGQMIQVEVPTHITGLMHFANGCICTLIESFDGAATVLPDAELQGTEGTMWLPDPNMFDGKIRVRKRGEKTTTEMPLTHPWAENSRGLGIMDMARCLLEGGTPRTDATLAVHVTEIMEKLHLSWDRRAYLSLETTCERPAPLDF